jgi:hypothetical protein
MLFKRIKKLEKEIERLNDLIEKKWSKEELQKNRDWEKIN